jgi:hypothetical protein
MVIEEPVRRKSGFFVTTRLAILGAILVALTITGVILATYFGKPSTHCETIPQVQTTTSANAIVTTTPEPVNRGKLLR